MNIESTLRADRIWRNVIRGAGLFLLIITAAIGIFLLYRGTGTFTIYGHSLSEFLFSTQWQPADTLDGGATLEPAFILSALLLPVLSPW